MNRKLIVNFLTAFALTLAPLALFAADNDPAASPGKTVTEIVPMTYAGETGFMVSNCPATNRSCIISPSKNPTYFWVSTNDPLYDTYLNLATASFVTGIPLSLYGTGTCVPDNLCGVGYERLGWASFNH